MSALLEIPFLKINFFKISSLRISILKISILKISILKIIILKISILRTIRVTTVVPVVVFRQAIQVGGRDLEGVEHNTSLFGVEPVVQQVLADLGDCVLDRGGVFKDGKVKGSGWEGCRDAERLP